MKTCPHVLSKLKISASFMNVRYRCRRYTETQFLYA
jgi:hypothetical protein